MGKKLVSYYKNIKFKINCYHQEKFAQLLKGMKEMEGIHKASRLLLKIGFDLFVFLSWNVHFYVIF